MINFQSFIFFFLDSSSPALSGRSGGVTIKRPADDAKTSAAKVAKIH